MKTEMMTAVGALALILAAPAGAHHSHAMFDMQNPRVIEGTVQKWQLTAPHSWLVVTVRQPDGQLVDWAFEGGGPSGPLRKDTFKVGDKVKVETHPMKDGRPAGDLGAVTFADGRRVNDRPPF